MSGDVCKYDGDFDPVSTPVDGTTLIEAGAGTGKTYTLTAVLLRLIAEHGIPIDRILVVTFTDSATAELRERIRSSLRAACRELQGEEPPEERFSKTRGAGFHDPAIALARLREAIVSFDLATICTIHGFCLRLLQDNSFESGSRFEMELEGDRFDVLRKTADDFWRSRIYGETGLFISYLMARRFTTDRIASILDKIPRGPYTRLAPQVNAPDTSAAEKSFEASFAELKRSWESSEADVAELLQSEPLKRNIYNPSSMNTLLLEMQCYLGRGNPDVFLFKGFDKFTTGRIGSSCKKGMLPPCHPFFDLCEIHMDEAFELEKIFSEKLVAYKSLAVEFADEALGRRKSDTGSLSYDDLLLDVHDALNGPRGREFETAVRRTFDAVLIDEFQDTDAVQWYIFKKIFHGHGLKVFLIGDPKQAIYGFRGADIYAYMRAAREAGKRYTLRKNWRSRPGLLSAVNSLFSGTPRPFVLEDIPYLPSTAGKTEDDQNSTLPPFNLWFLRPGEAETTVPRGKARTRIAEAVAGEIARLLDSGRRGLTRVDGVPLAEKHLAVLVRTNNEAALMQESLGALKIPSVRHQAGDVFKTREALELRRLIISLAEPKNRRLVPAALSTDIMGFRGEDLFSLKQDAGATADIVEKFNDYNALWHEQGFVRMFRHLLSRQHIISRLMSLPDGERRVTNLLHLTELLQQASYTRKLPETLIKWLTDRIESDTGEQEEHLLRLEKDLDAVTIVTIHKSKGLEYPVVFCPFCWGDSLIKENQPALVFHDPDHDFELVADISEKWSNRNLALAGEECLAENLRLLYVALTRARISCYLVWGKINKTETSAPAWLFHAPNPPPETDTLRKLAERCRSLTSEQLEGEVREAAAASGGNIEVSILTGDGGRPFGSPEKPAETLKAREFNGRIDTEWRVSSFSSLAHGSLSTPEVPDHDEISAESPVSGEPQPYEEPVPFADLFSFPRGTTAGTFFHDLLERVDFTVAHEAETADVVAAACGDYGFDLMWAEAVTEMLRNLVSTPLDPDTPALTLSGVGGEDRINELEFLFPLARTSPGTLYTFFSETEGPESGKIPGTAGRLQFSPVWGYMKGFMDMVFHREGRFYLVDWKSNFLGEKIEDYSSDALGKAMDAGLYRLQYHIYVLALDRYLALRLPGYRYSEHFGGVFYVFLRGINGAKDPFYGIFRDKPAEKTVAGLRSLLLDKAPEGRNCLTGKNK